jgi:hypothetical protein
MPRGVTRDDSEGNRHSLFFTTGRFLKFDCCDILDTESSALSAALTSKPQNSRDLRVSGCFFILIFRARI